MPPLPVPRGFAHALSALLVEQGRGQPTLGEFYALVGYDTAFEAAQGGDVQRVADAMSFILSIRRPHSVRPHADEAAPASSRLLDARRDAVTAWAHRIATAEPPVGNWRRHCLGSGLLTGEEVDSWIGTRLRSVGSQTLWWGAFLDERWMERNGLVSPRSQLGTLARLSQHLSERFAWTPAEATVFVLTGLVMNCFPIRARSTIRKGLSLDGTISHEVLSRAVITVDPRVSPAELSRWWAKARLAVMDLQPGERPLSLSSVRVSALAAFMASRWHPGMRWADDHRAWNTLHPEWGYTTLGGFRTEALRAMRQVGINPSGARPTN